MFLSRRQHMRVVADVVRQQANHSQRFDNLLLPRLGFKVGIQAQRKIEDLRNTLPRIERGRRILKDHANFLAAERVIAKRQRAIVNQQFAGTGFDHSGEHFCQR